jgi:hypothetical protein
MGGATIKSNYGVVFIPILSKYIGRELEVIVYEGFEGIESIPNGKVRRVGFV